MNRRTISRPVGTMVAWALVAICVIVPGARSETRRDVARHAVRGLAMVDSLLAVPDSARALRVASDLYREFAAHPVYGWQFEGRLGLALLLAKAPLKALPYLENVSRHQPLDPAHHRNLGAALLQLGRRGRALSEYRSAVELAPDNSDLRRELGQLLLAFGDTAAAANELAIARDLCGGCPELDQPLAALYLRQRDYARAVPPLQRLYEATADREHRQPLLSAMAQSGQDSALVAVLNAVPAGQRSGEEWRLLIDAEGRLGRSRNARLAVAALGPDGNAGGFAAVADQAPFWGQVALDLLAVGDYEGGLVATDRAIRLAPDSVVYRNNRVVLLTRLGREAEARAEWARVLTLDPKAAKRSP